MELDFELSKVINKIKDSSANRVVIQLPDGLKSKAGEIQEEIEKETSCEILIWAGSCFGACDIPRGLEEINADLLIQWGHSKWVS